MIIGLQRNLHNIMKNSRTRIGIVEHIDNANGMVRSTYAPKKQNKS